MAIDIFMNVPGIPADTTDPGFPQQFLVTGLSYSVANPASANGSVGVAKAVFSPITITLPQSKVPLFFKAVASGQAFQKVTFSFRKATGGSASGFTFETITLKLATITALQSSVNGGDDAPALSLSVSYGAINIVQSDPKASAPSRNPSSGGWNRVTNTADTNP